MDITMLKGVGPAKALQLQRELGIFTLGDLLMHFPYRYLDRSHVTKVSELDADSSLVVLRGHISQPQSQIGRTPLLKATFTDPTGSIELVWFKGLRWIQDSIKVGYEYLVMGKPTVFGNQISIAHPDLELLSGTQGTDHTPLPFIPVYNSTEKLKNAGLSSKGMARLMENAFRMLEGHLSEILPASVVTQYQLPSRYEAMRMIHFPRNHQEIAIATQRMKFEELFLLHLDYQYAKYERQRKNNGLVFNTVGEHFNRFYAEKLPFELTGAQKRVVKEIRNDMRSGKQMNRLLQGDVGSGKTLVALLCMLIALDNGCQSCLMAPTEILATQHYNTLCRMTEGLGIRIELLTGSVKAAAKRKIKQRLQEGEVDLLIGTHALIEDSVQFHNLGFVVIDEQHRFGVAQRSKLWTKNEIPPHILVMTATPIPRTLAMTLYGDLECSVIDELPPGRKPIRTTHATEAQRLAVYGFLRKQIALGRQVYVVYPLIQESEKMDLVDLMNGYDAMVSYFPLPQYQISIVHGKMPPDVKAYEMERFKKGEANIMVSTTVIEVGVDVPNATVMMVENAERFGLSQLHQLRGRVGRGADQSYCILMTKNNLSATAKERIQTMVNSNDGFRIAEADLKLRGPGDIQGLQQSGILDLRLADIVDDEPLVRSSRESVQAILDVDPTLSNPEHYSLLLYLRNKRNGINWGKIS